MTLPLTYHAALERPDLLAPPVAAALATLPWAGQVEVAAIDASLADTAQFCAAYGIDLAGSANCVVIAGRRGGEVSYAACMVTATTRADVNGVVRQRLGARKASFGPVDVVTGLTGMEFGGITPVGLPGSWPVLVDELVAKNPRVVIGSGIRGSKLWLAGSLLASLPAAEVVTGLGVEPAPPR